MANHFSGKSIWITGASSGIGEELAIQLSAAGAHLIISARSAGDLERVKGKCLSPSMVDISVFDLSDEKSIRAAAEKVLSTTPKIDILFNHGGISQRAEALETPLELERKIFEINFFGNILLSKLVASSMKKRKLGQIVVTSSLLGKWGFHTRSAYAASKHALHGYYDSMRMEVEKFGINITLVTPGFIATDISKHALNEKGEQTGDMDANQQGGMHVTECVRRILAGVSANKKEFGVGGKELLGLKLQRFVPQIFARILKKRSAK